MLIQAATIFFGRWTTRPRAPNAVRAREARQPLRQFPPPPANRLGVQSRDLGDQLNAAVSKALRLPPSNPPALALVQDMHQRPKMRVMHAIRMVLPRTAKWT
jgi:hypothetical protein